MNKKNVVKEMEEKPQTKAMKKERAFVKELAEVINRHSKENDSNTPDFILAQYLNDCLINFNQKQNMRSDWYESGTIKKRGTK